MTVERPYPPEEGTERARRAGQLARTVFVVGAAALASVAVLVAMAALELPDPEAALAAPRAPSVTVMDMDGRLIARRGPGEMEHVPLAELPPVLIDAVIAMEDRRFYGHMGVDAAGTLRAAMANLRARRVVQGGSTITQQLARNLFLSHDRTLKRKLQETLLAVWLERRFSKDEILEIYLNRVYFGAGAWGVRAASHRYFGKAPQMMSIGEAALLAGMLKAPSRYSPALSPRAAEDRATLVVNVMTDEGVLSPATRAKTLAEPIVIKRSSNTALAGHFVDWVVAQARELPGVAGTDLVIETTLDLAMQQAADRAAAAALDDAARAAGARQAALVALDGDGAVRAMVGGRDYRVSQFNRAVQARRQPGSAFKTFVYAAALERGVTPWEIRHDGPIEVEGWRPRNYREEHRGDVALSTAFARSINTVAVQISEEIGRHNVIATARRLGFTSDLPPTPAMALGAYEVSLLELTAAYAPFANRGYRITPYAINAVRAADGVLLYERPPPDAALALDETTRQHMTGMLRRVVVEGTGRAANPGREAAGKTGTTNDHRDAWFVGFVPGFVAGVWVGDDDFKPMDEVTGGGAPARLWRAFVQEALQDVPPRRLDLGSSPAVAGSPPATPSFENVTADDPRPVDQPAPGRRAEASAPRPPRL